MVTDPYPQAVVKPCHFPCCLEPPSTVFKTQGGYRSNLSDHCCGKMKRVVQANPHKWSAQELPYKKIAGADYSLERVKLWLDLGGRWLK